MTADNNKVSFNVLLYSLSFVIVLFLNRFLVDHLSLANYGDYKIFEALIYILTPLTVLGGHSGINLFLPSYMATNKYEKTIAYILFFSCIAVISLLLFIFVPTYLTPMLSNLFKHMHVESHSSYPFLFIVPVVAVFSMLAQTINCTNYQNLASFTNKVVFPSIFLISIVIFSAEQHVQSLNRIYYLYCLIYLVLTIFTAIALIILTKKLRIPHKQDFTITKWLSQSLPLLLNTIILAALIQVDLIILEAMTTDEKLTGIFSSILTLTTVFWVISSAQQFRYLPDMSVNLQNKQYDKLRENNKRYIISTITFTTPLIIFFILFPSHILHWFNPKLSGYLNPLIILSIGIYLFGPGNIKNTILSYSHHKHISVIINLVALTLLCISEYFLVPRFLLWGAIIPLITSRALITLISSYYCRRYFNLPFFY